MRNALIPRALFLVLSVAGLAAAPAAHAADYFVASQLKDITIYGAPLGYDFDSSLYYGASYADAAHPADRTYLDGGQGDLFSTVNDSRSLGNTTFAWSSDSASVTNSIDQKGPLQSGGKSIIANSDTSFYAHVLDVAPGQSVTVTANYNFYPSNLPVEDGFRSQEVASIRISGGSGTYVSTAEWAGNNPVGSLSLTYTNPIDSKFYDEPQVVISVSSSIAAVPEPGTWALSILGFGLTGLGWVRRRKGGRQISA